jgi:thioredoxin-dependent peroxiredoxin
VRSRDTASPLTPGGIDALQASDTNGIVTPANWQPGDKVLLPTHLSDPEANEMFPRGWQKIRDYFRVTDL